MPLTVQTRRRKGRIVKPRVKAQITRRTRTSDASTQSDPEDTPSDSELSPTAPLRQRDLTQPSGNTHTQVSDDERSDISVFTSRSRHQPPAGFNSPCMPFSGDPAKLTFFLSNVRELQNIFAWTEKEAAYFLKSNLKGQAID